MSEPDTLPPTPGGNSASALEHIVSRFENAWQAGAEPPIDDFLPHDDERLGALIELALTDMEYRVRAGQSIRVESYLQRYPEMADNAAVVLDLIAAEHRLRQRNESELGMGEFLQRFPKHRKAIADRLQAASSQPATTLIEKPFRPLPSAAESLPTIPGYEILGLLGQGGMGVVYQARQNKLNRLAALKMIRSGSRPHAEMLTRFLAEARAVARLQHPNIVQVYEADEHDGQPYIALEFVDGGSLHHKLSGQPLPPRDAALLLLPLAQAIHAAHQRGIVHRDLKPANVLLTADGTPKITDFGLVKHLDDDAGQTSTGAILGTPSYMSPEQAEGKIKEVGPATDVYALGAIHYEMLTGRPPFRGATTLDTLEQVRSQEPVPPSRLQPKVPRDLETICLKCLQKDAQRRYASAAELGDDVQRFLNGEPIQARPVSEWVVLWRWCKRNRALAATSVVAAGAIGVVITFVVLFLTNRLDSGADARMAEEKDRAKRAEADREWFRLQQEELNRKSVAADEDQRRRLAEMEKQLAKRKSQVEEVDSPAPKKAPDPKINSPAPKKDPVPKIDSPPPKKDPNIDKILEQLRTGKIKAPDFRSARELIKEDFSDPKTSWFSWAKGLTSVEAGRLLIRDDATGAFGNGAFVYSNFACEMVGRVSMPPKDGWGLQLMNITKVQGQNYNRGLEVILGGDGKLNIWPARWSSAPTLERHWGPFTPPMVVNNAEFNSLLVRVHGRYFEVYVNGVMASLPIMVDYELSPTHLQIAYNGGQKGSLLEFKSFTVWSAEGYGLFSDTAGLRWEKDGWKSK